MFIGSFSFGWLERSFHFLLSLKGSITLATYIHLFKSGTKVRVFCQIPNFFDKNKQGDSLAKKSPCLGELIGNGSLHPAGSLS